MFVIQIIYNLAVLVTVSVVSGFIDTRWNRKTKIGKILQGITFGLIAILGMLNPFKISPGIIFDGRSIVLSICSLFFGPLAGIIAGSMAIIIRIIIGGGGTFMGLSVIASSVIIGLLYYFKRQRNNNPVTLGNLYFFGIVVHIVMLILMSLLPANFVWITFQTIAVSVMIFYPIATVIIGKILIDQEDNTKLVQDLRESEERYRLIAQNTVDSIAVFDLNMNYTYVSPSVVKMLGYTPDELIELGLMKIVAPDSLPVIHQAFENEMKIEYSGKGDPERNIVITTQQYQKNGSLIWVESTVSFIRDKTGKPINILAVSRDITERKEAETKIFNSLQEKEILLKEIHHRVKNNFQIITSLLSLQAENISDEKILDIFQDSQNRIKSMSLIHELMYSTENFIDINLKNYITRLIEFLKSSYSPDDSKITIDLEVEEISLSLDNLIPIGLIINELISNSFKHAFPDGRKGNIIISLKAFDNENYLLSVKDTGIGLPKDFDLQKIKSLGMFLVSTLSKQIDGKLRFSGSDAGTEITIVFLK